MMVPGYSEVVAVDDKAPRHEYDNKHCPQCRMTTRMVRIVGDNQWLCTRCLTECKECRPLAHDGSAKEQES